MRALKSLMLVLLFLTIAVGLTAAQALPDPDAQQPPPQDDGPNPVMTLTGVIAEMDPDGRGLSNKVAAALRQARTQSIAALDEYVAIEPRLPLVKTRLRAAVTALDKAKRLSNDAALDEELNRHQVVLVGVARELADGVLQIATNAGVARAKLNKAQNDLLAGDALADQDNHGGAINYYGKILPLKNNVVFDPDTFEVQVRGMLDSQTTGYAVAVNRNGQLVHSWGAGNRLTTQDMGGLPAVPMTPSDEMNVASVSKTLTAVMALYHMGDEGISVDDPIADYLPGDWTLGPNVADGAEPLTFRHLMTHTSGLGGRDGNNRRQSCGVTFDSMKTCLAAGSVLADRTFFYDNGNFALFRVMMAYLDGKWCNDPNNPDCPEATDEWTAERYRRFAQCGMFAWMGIGSGEPLDDLTGCEGPNTKPNLDEGTPTPYHYAPNLTLASQQPDDWTFWVGGGGWYMSALELAQYMAHMRYNNTILEPSYRNAMYKGFLGFMNPANGYSFATGSFGAYHMHGGDLCYPGVAVPTGVSRCSATDNPATPNVNENVQPRGVDTCVADFPTGIQATLLINSMGGNYNGQYQCGVLGVAYENSFVVK